MENVIIDVEEMRQELTGINQQLEIHINSQYDLINSLEDYVNDLELTGKAMKATKIYTEQIKIVLLRAYIVVLEYFMETNSITLIKLEEAFEDDMDLLDYQTLINKIDTIDNELIAQNNIIFELFINPYVRHPSLERKREEYNKLIEAIQYFDEETKSLYQDIDEMLQEIMKNNEITMGNHNTQQVQMTWTHSVLATHNVFLEELKNRGYDLELIYEDLSKCTLEQREDYKKSLTLTLDGLNGEDWTVVQELLNRGKEDPLQEGQYEALIYLVDSMTTDQLEKFTNMAIKNNKALNFSELSEVFVELSNRYFYYGEAASLMIASGYAGKSEDKKLKIIIGKQIVLESVCKEFSKEIRGIKRVTIGCEDEIGRYKLNVAHTRNEGQNMPIGLFHDVTVDNLYDIYEWGSADTIDGAGDIHVINWMDGLDKSREEIFGEYGIASATKKALKKLGGLANASPHLAVGNTSVKLLSSQLNNEYLGKEILLNTSIQKASSYYKALGISGALVVSHSDSLSSVVHSKIDYNKLEVHVNEYNKEEELKITTDIANGLYDSEQSIELENFASWFIGGGDRRVESYWIDIESALLVYRSKYDSFENVTAKELSLEDLKFIISEIDAVK